VARPRKNRHEFTEIHSYRTELTRFDSQLEP
jgi:hypothetical protein